ncbi:MAG: hypothetical protein H0X73_01950 [Chthoniobacterales bacterium]|nr:hypothetical protein [Chthoniobacterales bacterium]
MEKIGYRITQSTATQSQPNAKPIAQVQGSQTIPAAGGKFKTVVVEAFMSGDKINDTKRSSLFPATSNTGDRQFASHRGGSPRRLFFAAGVEANGLSVEVNDAIHRSVERVSPC